jgi:hypothetical protein
MSRSPLETIAGVRRQLWKPNEERNWARECPYPSASLVTASVDCANVRPAARRTCDRTAHGAAARVARQSRARRAAISPAGVGESGARKHRTGENIGAVRHNETRCTSAQRNGPKRAGDIANETAQNRAYGSTRMPVNRSLDHGIGFESLPPSPDNDLHKQEQIHGNHMGRRRPTISTTSPDSVSDQPRLTTLSRIPETHETDWRSKVTRQML